MKSKVYFTSEITPESLIKIYESLGVELTGNVGVKVSTGEDGAKGYLKKELIAPLVQKLNGTILECNTAYPGARTTYEEHIKVAEKHGFTSFAKVDIMDKVLKSTKRSPFCASPLSTLLSSIGSESSTASSSSSLKSKVSPSILIAIPSDELMFGATSAARSSLLL